jgi:hypothetical protein
MTDEVKGPIEQDANGSFLTPQIADATKEKWLKASLKAVRVMMTTSQWKKLQANYGHLEPTCDLNVEGKDAMIFGGLDVSIHNHMPASEIWFVDRAGAVVAKIVGLEK